MCAAAKNVRHPSSAAHCCSAVHRRLFLHMQQDQLFFEKVKVERGWYFIEYCPPVPADPFAILQLIILDGAEVGRVAGAMEQELASWLERYSVPIMVSSFDDTGKMIALDSVRSWNHLIGWRDLASGKFVSHWRLVENGELPRTTWDSESLKSIYHDIHFRTSKQLYESARKEGRVLRLGWWLVFIWLVMVPIGIALIQLMAPQWLVRLAFC